MRHLVLALALLPLTASAYELRRDSTGEIVRWPSRVDFVVDKDLAAGIGDAQAFAAIQAAAEAMSAAAPNLTVTVQAGDTGGVGYDFAPNGKNQNDIVVPSDWPYDQNAIAVTVVTVDTRTHRIIDADIAFNIKHRKFKVLSTTEPLPGQPEHDDIQNTFTHELGHALGLAHNAEDPEVVMYPSARRGETKKRNVAADDAAGLAVLYPADGLDTTANPQGAGDLPLGCSSTGGDSLWIILLLALPLLALRRPRAVVAAVTIASATAIASPLERSDAPALEAEVVATAKVVAARTVLPTQGKLLQTELELELRECLKGNCVQRAILVVPGGRLGDIEQYVDGLSTPKPGEVVGYTVPQGHSARLQRPQVYRLQQLRDFSAFARGTRAAGLTFKAQQPGSTSTSPTLLTPKTQR